MNTAFYPNTGNSVSDDSRQAVRLECVADNCYGFNGLKQMEKCGKIFPGTADELVDMLYAGCFIPSLNKKLTSIFRQGKWQDDNRSICFMRNKIVASQYDGW
jgi:hypothetical protein